MIVMLVDKWDNLKLFFRMRSVITFLQVVLHNRKTSLPIYFSSKENIETFRQLTAGAAPAQAAAQPAAAAAATPTTTNTSPFLSILEAEKQTAASLATMNNQEQKTHGQARTPGKIYNWDG
jgi:hypothetical protein